MLCGCACCDHVDDELKALLAASEAKLAEAETALDAARTALYGWGASQPREGATLDEAIRDLTKSLSDAEAEGAGLIHVLQEAHDDLATRLAAAEAKLAEAEKRIEQLEFDRANSQVNARRAEDLLAASEADLKETQATLVEAGELLAQEAKLRAAAIALLDKAGGR